MWQIDNRTPFAVEQGWVRNKDGAEVWLVVVKSSFDVRPDGTVEVAMQQPVPLRTAEHHGEPGKSSIRYESDFVLSKPTTDVLVVGQAHAPPGSAVGELDVGFRVGPLKKLLRVIGDRRWGAFGPAKPMAFVTMPIVYERAFGGVDLRSRHPENDWDARNPVGCGYAVDVAHLAGQPVPNIEMPDAPIRAWDDRPAPAGFGAIASHWQPRASFAGTYDARWEARRQPLLPDDFDDRFFQCAPADQQTPQYLRGGEIVNWLNLSPHGRVTFALPTIELSLETRFSDGERRVHEAPKLHTLIMEPDLMRVSLVWHSALECHAKVYRLDSTRVRWRRAADEETDDTVDDLMDLI